MRSCNNIKQKKSYALDQLKAIRPKLKKEKIQDELNRLSYESIFSVDYSNDESFSVELSFTMLDWRILERIINDRAFDFANVDMKQIMQMCFNVFPRIKSVFHRLAENQHVCDLNVL